MTKPLAERIAAELRSLSAHRLASLADAPFQPDSSTSPGAAVLDHVAEDVAEAITWHLVEDGMDLGAALDHVRDERRGEIADAAVPIYTHDLWSAFTDLGAWQEDPSELGATVEDMDGAARAALYMIADRLAYALVDLVAELTGADTEPNP